MEQLNNISLRTGLCDQFKLSVLAEYAVAIHKENNKHNLTGHKTLPEIIENLIIGSIEPLKNIEVPRGTLFADIGTGAGIPGIPLSVYFNDCRGILFDSNQKKIRFVNKTISDFGLVNVNGIDSRVEDACRCDEYREKFDIVFTRAMSDIYTVAELSAPLLKTGGVVFLYIKKTRFS